MSSINLKKNMTYLHAGLCGQDPLGPSNAEYHVTASISNPEKYVDCSSALLLMHCAPTECCS